jgi:hypothetical protein
LIDLHINFGEWNGYIPDGILGLLVQNFKSPFTPYNLISEIVTVLKVCY